MPNDANTRSRYGNATRANKQDWDIREQPAETSTIVKRIGWNDRHLFNHFTPHRIYLCVNFIFYNHIIIAQCSHCHHRIVFLPFACHTSGHFQVRKQKKGYLVEEGRQFIAYKFNQHYMKSPGQPIVALFDFSDAGVSNMVGICNIFPLSFQSLSFVMACGPICYPLTVL